MMLNENNNQAINTNNNDNDYLAGFSFKPRYFEEIIKNTLKNITNVNNQNIANKDSHNIDWFEIHAENYFAEGGPAKNMLRKLREHYPISIHGVSLNLGGSEELDKDHLVKLKKLCTEIEPMIVSEHLAWCRHDGAYFNDLLPLPYNKESFDNLCSHIEQTQDFLQRKILIENPSLYLAYDKEKTGIIFEEYEFLNKVCAKTGCGLLLDINNIYVASKNIGYDPYKYMDKIDINNVEQIHLAGHSKRKIDNKEVLIDTHSKSVIDEVWQMFEHFIDMCKKDGTKKVPPSLIEWDNDLPEFSVICSEISKMRLILEKQDTINLAYA